MALNNIIIQGRLVRDPELKQTNSGKAVISNTVAVDRGTADKATDFISIVAYDKTAEFIGKYFTKGSQILVSGRLQIRPWEDKEGNKRESAEVVVREVNFCGAKGQQTTDGPLVENKKASGWEDIGSEDLPF